MGMGLDSAFIESNGTIIEGEFEKFDWRVFKFGKEVNFKMLVFNY